MTDSEKHNAHYIEKFTEHFSKKDAKIYLSVGADISGALTIGCSDNITHKDAIMVMKKMIIILEQMQN